MTTRKEDQAKAVQAPDDGQIIVPQTAEKAAGAQQPVETVATTVGSFPIVGVGASAGGLAAFEAFFSGMPADTEPGMAFVLVQHLAPDHKSILSDLIRRYTRMQVFEVEDGMVVQPNCAYIIPPGRDMAFLKGTLHLLEPSEPRGRRLPIDFFFRSLAQDQSERAIGIVLSGTGSDGTLGVRAIKSEGGMVMAQNPASTEFDGMPRSAIATGLVDYQLPPAEMPARLIAYAVHAFGKLTRPATVRAPKTENAMKKIFILLRAQTSHDFSDYKPSTIHRRIERRMAVHQIEAIDRYVEYLQQTPTEVGALFRDLLIGVTNFFRDPETFQVLEERVIPKLFEGKPAGAVVRVWTAGCSTGEEAYSIAILLQERMEALKQSYTMQCFATDIDKVAIATARTGLYPASIAADISPERLARFFTAEPGGSAYRIHKSIRDMLVFSEQEVIKDPPFSKLDLISCRNLLIYLGTGLQKKLLHLFHYALKPDGVLFLGTSEGVGDFGELFVVLDRKAKLYQRKEGFHGTQRGAVGRFVPPMTAVDVALPRQAARTAVPAKQSLRALTEQALLQHVVSAGALVNGQGDIVYLHGRTGMFLEPAAGEAGINNILKMAREGLWPHLSTGLHKAAITNEVVRCPCLRVKTNGDFTTVNLTIRPVTASPATSFEEPLYLVILEEAPPADPEQAQPAAVPASAGTDGAATDAEARIAALKQELQSKDEYLQSTYEELASSNEELKSANEEMQSVNEELQSANEELETSKEELQSVNEELATVNVELQTNVVDLSRANNDMNNLLAGTGIGTVFVDYQLRVLRFTPTASVIINLILSDVGRPVGHLVSNLVGYDCLVADLQAVLDTLAPKEVIVQTTEGRWYTMRIQPYRTLDNVIEGAVISFFDITEMVRTGNALRESEERFRTLAALAPAGIYVSDREGRYQYANRRWCEMAGLSLEEALGDGWVKGLHQEDRPFVLSGWAKRLASEGHRGLEYRFQTPAGKVTWVYGLATPQRDDWGNIVGYIGINIDITDRKLAEERLHKANEGVLRLAVVVRDAYDAVTVQDLDGRILAWNPGAVRMYGWSEAEALLMNVRDRIPQGLHEEALSAIHRLSRAEILEPYRTHRITKESVVVAVSMISTALVNEDGQLYAIATTERTIDESKDRPNDGGA